MRVPQRLKNIRWRTAEERAEAHRKIDAIRRAAERERMNMGEGINPAVLKSPKVILGILILLTVIGGMLISAAAEPYRPSAPDGLTLDQRRARKSLTAIATAMTFFRVHTKQWPSQRLGLFALAKRYDAPNWKGPYINWAYKDPWGTPYVYRMPLSPFQCPELFSCGPDMKPDTPDDIRAYEDDFTCNEGTWHAATEAEAPAEAQSKPTRKESRP